MPDQEQRSSDWEQDRGYALVPRGSDVVGVDVGAATSGVPWILFLLLIVVLLTLTSSAYYVAWHWAAADARYLASVEQAAVWLQRLDTHATQLKAGRPDSFAELRKARDGLGDRVAALGRRPWKAVAEAGSPGVNDAFIEINRVWNDLSARTAGILALEAPVRALDADAKALETALSRLLVTSDALANALVAAKVPAEQIYVTGRQVTLLQRLLKNVRWIVEGDRGAVSAADRVGRDAVLFGQVLNALLAVEEYPGIQPVEDEASREILEELAGGFRVITGHIGQLMENSTALFRLRDETGRMTRNTQDLRQALGGARQAHQAADDLRGWVTGFGHLLGVVAFGTLILLVVRLRRDSRRRAEALASINREISGQAHAARDMEVHYQAATRHLLDEVDRLAHGDYSTRGPVLPEAASGVPEALDWAANVLRRFASNVSNATSKAMQAAGEIRERAMHLTNVGDRQLQSLGAAAASARHTVAALEGLSTQALASREATQQFGALGQQGVETAREAADALHTAEDAMRSTSRHVQDLEGKLQQLSELVASLDDITDQTNILALNAGIQASTAGESARGFADVADQVQRLAERAGRTVQHLETLVRSTQSATEEVARSMKRSGSAVGAGGGPAQRTLETIGELETLGVQLNERVGQMEDMLNAQGPHAATLPDAIELIARMVAQVRPETDAMVKSLGELGQFAAHLPHIVPTESQDSNGRQ